MWTDLWNAARLVLTMEVGRNRGEVQRIVKRLKAARRSRIAVRQDSDSDRALVSNIKDETRKWNRNNLTRTDAYLSFFAKHPEIHWALLAHCVSRNGGWAMTDTRGEWFLRLASHQQSQPFFAFLERANWLIFEDAYPQLLLYRESKKRGQNLSYLLPSFDVSLFMQVMWDIFWETRDSALLTRALIINEQNRIEHRIVKNPAYEETVESSIQFQLESFLNLNQILMPYRLDGKTLLAGTTVRHFQSVNDRILTGLTLYQALYQDRRIHQAIVEFATTVPHRGTRSDYWPHHFTPVQRGGVTDEPYVPKFTHPNLAQLSQNARTAAEQSVGGHSGQSVGGRGGQSVGERSVGRQSGIEQSGGGQSTRGKVYSPPLGAVWSDVDHTPAEPGDWFRNLRHAVYLFLPVPRQPFDITDKYVSNLRTIERIIMVKERARDTVRGVGKKSGSALH